MHPAFESAMDDLLDAWRRHHDNRRRRAAIPDLAQTRLALDHARETIHQLRRRLAPTADELRAAPMAATCAIYGVPVLVAAQDLEVVGPTVRYRCVCGAEERVAMP